jgi:hypothetical protein
MKELFIYKMSYAKFAIIYEILVNSSISLIFKNKYIAFSILISI